MNLPAALQYVKRHAFPRAQALEQELNVVKAESRSIMEELEQLREEFASSRQRDAQRIDHLNKELVKASIERNLEQDRIRNLETSLAEAALNQEDSKQYISSLESRLEETRNQHQASLNLGREALTRLQAEQHDLLGLQTELSQAIHDIGQQTLETMTQIRADVPRLSLAHMALMAGLLFLSGSMTSALVMSFLRQPTVNLSGLDEEIRELRELSEIQYSSHEKLSRILEQMQQDQSARRIMPEGRSSGDTASSVLPEKPRATRQSNSRRAGKAVDAVVEPVIPAAGGKLTLQQRDKFLRSLGFTDGENQEMDDASRVAGALGQFRKFYLPTEDGQSPPDIAETDTALAYYANLATSDERRFEVDSRILAAIRLASVRSGVDFSFLMELAAVESNFEPLARASTSTAVGLYQFKEESWLDAINRYGKKYGLAGVAESIHYVADNKGVMQPVIHDETVRQFSLDLRLNPLYSALLAAENVNENSRQLIVPLKREPERTELYLTHFFGTSGAISFLRALADNPHQIASDIFPGPARRNQRIFNNQSREPRSVAEVYEVLDRKFNTARYEDHESG